MDYFSSDWHLGHANILKFDKRDFRNVDEHDDHIMKMAMRTLKSGDNFYYLGDFALCKYRDKVRGWIQTLASSGANLFFIIGNHDKADTTKLYREFGTLMGEKRTLRFMHEGVEHMVVLDHFANRVWNKSHHGSYHLYGHSHDGLEKEPWGKSMDVGIMSALRIKGEYSLFTFPEIHDILSKRPTKVIDHHGLKARGYEVS